MVWFLLFSGHWLVFHEDNALNRTALVRMHGEIGLGSAPEEVREVYRRNATPSLRLLSEQADRWTVRMPIEWGATDWTLLVDFQQGRVSSVRVRTLDGPAPEDGPPDRPAAPTPATADLRKAR